MDLTLFLNFAETAGIVIAAVGVWLGYWSLRATRLQAATSFEDGIAREYREIARRIPVDALLGKDLPEERFEEVLNEVYNYVDLCNEQVFLRQTDRIRAETWAQWCDGIRSNLARPAFRQAWELIKHHSDGDFAELRRLESGGFKDDPRERDSR